MVSISVIQIIGSSEIWSDKLSLLHIKVTQRVGEHGGEKRKRQLQFHRGAEGTKSDRAVVYVLLISLVINVVHPTFRVIRQSCSA